MSDFYYSPIMEPVRLFIERVVQFLPNVFLMLVVVLVGAVAARLARSLLSRFLKLATFDRFCERLGVGEMLERGGIRQSPSELAGIATFWMLALVFFFMALSALNLPATTDLVSQFFGYLPHLLVALGILATSYLLSRFVHRSVLIASVNAHIRHAGILARSAQGALLVLGFAIALEHLAIGRGVVLAAFSITFGGVVLALALAFGLAGKDMARDFLERNLRRQPPETEERETIHHL